MLRPNGQALPERVAALAAGERDLQGQLAAVEHAFVETGAGLQEQARLSAELAAIAGRLNAFTAAPEEANPVRAAIATVGEALAALETFQQESDALADNLRQQYLEITQLRQHAGRLERAIAPLRIVDTLFRIEAATLPPEMQAAFAALTVEIAQLDRRVRETFTHQFSALGDTRDAIGAAIGQIDAQQASQQRAVLEQSAAMRTSIGALENDISRLRQREERATALVRRIDQETNAIIVGLQYQDITRQKLEHVLAALADLPPRARAETPSATAFIGRMALLQATQLAAVEQDLRTAIAGIDSGLRAVLAGLGEVQAEGLGRDDCAAIGRHVGATIDALLRMLAELRVPLAGLAEQSKVTALAVRSFGGVTADLGDTIRELTWSIRLIALNAQVQAAQVARCDGLEVLARHIYSLSDETSSLAEGLGRDLAGMGDRLARIIGQAGRLEEQSLAAHDRITAAAGREERALQAQRADVVDALDQFPALLERTRAGAAQLLERAALGRVDQAPLRTLQAGLEQLGEWCRQGAPDAAADANVREEFAALAQHYTMESERVAHEAALEGRAIDARALGSGMAVAGGTRPVPSPDPAPTTIPAAATSAAAAVPASAALGDNVELF